MVDAAGKPCLVLAAVAALAVQSFAVRALALPPGADRNGDGKLVIACLGDSNTASDWQHARPGGFPAGRGWCELLVESFGDPDVVAYNIGAPGGTAVDHFLKDMPADRRFFDGAGQLDHVLEVVHPDVVIMAFGTNDVLKEHKATPERIVATYRRLAERAASHGVVVLVASAPEAIQKTPQSVVRRPAEPLHEINRRLAAAFPAMLLLDFNSILTPDDYMDGLHMNGVGQAKRATEARGKLVALLDVLPEPAGIRALTWSNGRWSSPEAPAIPAPIGVRAPVEVEGAPPTH